jgi:hypothetical protein
MSDSSLGALQELKDAISQESCIPKPPFIELGEGNASILNYNIPQATCYSATALVKLTIPLKSFKASERTVPVDNFWDIHASRSIDAIRVDLDTRVRALPRQSLLADAFELNARSVASAQAGANVESLKVAIRDDILADSVTEKPMVRFYKPEVTKDLVSVRIKQGYMPVPYIRFSGLRDFYYIPKPITPKPQISIVLHYKVCSFLGDYGAGQTIKTFSLLPGEKTYLCNIIDYTGTKTSFIELIREDNANCINPTAPHVVSDYVRKRRINKVIDGVTYSVELEQTAKGKTVPGIITSVQSRIVRTSSLVVDALLGQGEALDCYNQKLQDAASINAHLTNLENVQKINTIELMAPDVRPDAYKKIFGECCPTPQNVLCNCNTPTPDA